LEGTWLLLLLLLLAPPCLALREVLPAAPDVLTDTRRTTPQALSPAMLPLWKRPFLT
jgi:hypothetical protein